MQNDVPSTMDSRDGKPLDQARIENELLFSALQHAPFGAVVASTDPQGKMLYVNGQFTFITGYTLEDVPTVTGWIERAYPDPAYREMVLANWPEDVNPVNMHRDVIYKVRCHDGSEKNIQFRASFLGKDLMFVMLLDVSERERITRDLHIHNWAMNSCATPVAYAGMDFKLFFANPAFIATWGYESADEVIGRNALEFWQHPEEAARVAESIQEKGAWRGELTGKRRDGECFPVLSCASVATNPSGEPLCMMAWFVDLTEKKKTEAEQRQLQECLHLSERLQAIGQLAGGIAHDFNNLLTPIIGNVEYLQDRFPQGDEELNTILHDIRSAGLQAASLVEQLLTFARRREVRFQPVDMHKVVREVQSLLSHSIDRRNQLVLDLKAENPMVNGDEGRLRTALLNLGLNARDAMPEGGTVTYSSRSLRADPGGEICDTFQVAPGDYLELRVSDTGCGMTPEELTHIFEPFYTTKPQGEGSGLGLSSVHGSIKQHRGGIHVTSQPDRGSTFTLLFPAIRDTVQPDQPALPLEQSTSPGAHILIVDDEPGVRRFLSRLLGNNGYRTTTCANGLEAIEAYSSDPDAFDLMLLDVVMPKLDGATTFRQLKQRHPDLNVILISGFDRDQRVQSLLEEGVFGFLPKPLSARNLLEKITACLADHVPGS